MLELRDYLHCLQKEYDKYYRIFVEQNGSDSAEKLINTDEDAVLVRKVERLKKIIIKDETGNHRGNYGCWKNFSIRRN